MACTTYQKSALDAVNLAAQTLTANGSVAFATNTVLTGTSIQHTAGSTTVTIPTAGLYEVTFNADVVVSSAGDETVQLYNNSTAVPAAQATFTGTTTALIHVCFNTLLTVPRSCCVVSNTANLQVQVSAAAEVENAKITVVRLA